MILIAAHCFQVKGRPSKKYEQDVTAVIGVHNISDLVEVSSATHKVWQVIIHDSWDYNSDEYDADISLVVLETEVDLSDRFKVGIVCLPPASKKKFMGTGTVVGWGFSEVSEANHEYFDSTPNEVDLSAVTRLQCEKTGYDLIIASSERTFCAVFLNQNKSTYRGDSGDGFTVFVRSTNLAGIVSSSKVAKNNENCNIDTYSIFTDVGKFVKWIKSGIKKTEKVKWKNIEFECRYFVERS